MEKITKQSALKGIHISRMHIVIILMSAVLYILLTATAYRVSSSLWASYTAMDISFVTIENEKLLLDGSDYLTEQARLYAVALDDTYIDNYFTELYDTRSRETAVEKLVELELDEKVTAYWLSAKDESDALTEPEIYAMRLAAASQNREPALLVREVSLTEEDAALSSEEQLNKAQNMLFGTEYCSAKQQIRDDINYASSELIDSLKVTMERGHENFKQAMSEHKILILIHAVGTVIGFVLTILLVVLPMTYFVKHIKAGEKMRVVGAYECKCLAQTYNTMFAQNIDNQHRLRHQAEHDALTGLLNRGAFENLRQKLSAEKKPVGLLIVDVDKFKQVNDGYGHEMGDKVLQRVANLLTENFQEIGSPCRVGGDEFSVILTKASQEQEKSLQARVEAINDLLTHPKDGLPVVSLSVGGAFSGEGFTDGLYKRADAALYVVKENGRCGCRFYSSEMADIAV